MGGKTKRQIGYMPIRHPQYNDIVRNPDTGPSISAYNKISKNRSKIYLVFLGREYDMGRSAYEVGTTPGLFYDSEKGITLKTKKYLCVLLREHDMVSGANDLLIDLALLYDKYVVTVKANHKWSYVCTVIIMILYCCNWLSIVAINFYE